MFSVWSDGYAMETYCPVASAGQMDFESNKLLESLEGPASQEKQKITFE